jgi:ribose-phosphate pyrophosphokinase
LIVFATASYEYLRTEFCDRAGAPAGQVERRDFPDGEHYHRIRTDVSERDVVLIGGTITDAEALELYDLGCGLVQEGAGTLTLVLPFLGYSTMDRAINPGEIVKAKTRARLLSSIPQAARGNRVVLVDLHAEGLVHYFEGEARPFHARAHHVVLDTARQLGGDDYVMACTDAGRAKIVEWYGVQLGVPVSFVFKRRSQHDGGTHVTAVSAQVEGKRVVVYDDMIRTGGSLLSAGRAYLDAGATSLAAITTHGLFPGDALERIRDSGIFTSIACTNTHPRAVELASQHPDYLRVQSIAPLLTEFVARWF